jgi:N-acetylmuramic acid 6-phosphate etherase
MKKTTESDSIYDGLDKMSVSELLLNINREDKTVANSVEKQLPKIEELVEAIIPKMKIGGRLFYIGAGTSGRIGIVDASECPPTFGVDHGLVIGLMAGGDKAMRIIGKQRNGPIGTVNLTFLKEYTRFENFANDGYSDDYSSNF